MRYSATLNKHFIKGKEKGFVKDNFEKKRQAIDSMKIKKKSLFFILKHVSTFQQQQIEFQVQVLSLTIFSTPTKIPFQTVFALPPKASLSAFLPAVFEHKF